MNIFYKNRESINFCLADVKPIFNLTSVKTKQKIIENLSSKIH